MNKTNASYSIVLHGKRTTEHYYRDQSGWLKVSTRGRVFRATAEQVLNHLLPALALGGELGLTIQVQHYDSPYWQTVADLDAAGEREQIPLQHRHKRAVGAVASPEPIQGRGEAGAVCRDAVRTTASSAAAAPQRRAKCVSAGCRKPE